MLFKDGPAGDDWLGLQVRQPHIHTFGVLPARLDTREIAVCRPSPHPHGSSLRPTTNRADLPVFLIHLFLWYAGPEAGPTDGRECHGGAPQGSRQPVAPGPSVRPAMQHLSLSHTCMPCTSQEEGHGATASIQLAGVGHPISFSNPISPHGVVPGRPSRRARWPGRAA